MAIINVTITSTGIHADDDSALRAIPSLGSTGDTINVTLAEGSAGPFNMLNSPRIVFSGDGYQFGPPIYKSFHIFGDATNKTRIYGGKDLFVIENLGTEYDFSIQNIWFQETWIRPLHLRWMRHCTVKDCKIETSTMIGRGGAAKTWNGQSESEAWGIKIGCFKSEGGPVGNILIDNNYIDLHTGDYSGDGAEDMISRGIHIMVCPTTSRAVISNNIIRGASERGTHITDTRGSVEIYNNLVYMDAPFVHKGSLNKYHMCGAFSGSAFGYSNGYSLVQLPVDNGEVNIHDNRAFVYKKDMNGCNFVAVHPTKAGPLSFNNNEIILVKEDESGPVAGIFVDGVNNASFSSCTISGDGYCGVLVGARSLARYGTSGNTFLNNNVEYLNASSGVAVLFGADAENNTLVGHGELKETVQFPVDSSLLPLKNGNYVTGHHLVEGDVQSDLQIILDNVRDNDTGLI